MRLLNYFILLLFITSLSNSCKKDDDITIPKNGLVAHYTFSNGTAKDLCGQNNGIVVNASSANDRFSKPNESLSFSSINSKVRVKNPNFTGNSQGTFVTWVKFNELDRAQYIASASDTNSVESYISLIRLDPTTHTLGIYQRETGLANWVNGSTVIEAGKYYYVVMESDGLSWSLYVDGIKETLTVKSGSNTGKWINDLSSIDIFTIGNLLIQGSYTVPYLNGNIDGVLVYDRPLSEDEIKSINSIEK